MTQTLFIFRSYSVILVGLKRCIFGVCLSYVLVVALRFSFVLLRPFRFLLLVLSLHKKSYCPLRYSAFLFLYPTIPFVVAVLLMSPVVLCTSKSRYTFTTNYIILPTIFIPSVEVHWLVNVRQIYIYWDLHYDVLQSPCSPLPSLYDPV